VKAWEKGHDLAPAADYAPLARGVGALIIALLAQVQQNALRLPFQKSATKYFSHEIWYTVGFLRSIVVAS
jgi:hypothetical protein